MADIITVQQMQGASLDAQALEKFINGSDSETVLTRLNAKYPTLQKAIKTLFENGGLPAVPFATKALMTASSLENGKYAVVTNDQENTGLYLKEEAGFTKVNYGDLYSEAIKTKNFILDALNASGIELYKRVNYTTIPDKVVNNNFDVSGDLNPTVAGGKAIRVNVSALAGFYVVGSSITASAAWYWIFTDASFNFIAKTLHTGDGYVSVPAGAVKADRTFSNGIISETEKFALQIVKNTKKDLVDSAVDTIQFGINSNSGIFVTRGGSVVNMTEDETTPILTSGAGRKFAKVVGLSDFRALQVSFDAAGSNIHPAWDWLFIFPDGSKKIARGTATSNLVEVPDGAIIAYKSAHIGGTTTYTTKDLVVTGVLKSDYTAKTINRLEHELSILSADSPISQRSVVNINDFDADTQTEQLKQAVAFVKFRGHGVIEIARDKKRNTDIWLVDEAILLPSNCWIYINNVTVQKAPKLFDNVFRNDGIVPSADRFGFATALNENINIRIFGNDKRKSHIRGNMDDPYVGTNPITGKVEPFLGDFFGWRTFCVLFANTKDFHVHNLRYGNTNGWANSNEHGCDDFSYHDLFFDTAGKNSDGVDIRLGCKNFKVYNIEGTTRDDMVACTALKGFAAKYPSNNYAYPSEIGGTADRGHGVDISHGEIYNIIGDNANEALLILATGGSKVHHIDVSNITDRDGGFAFNGVHILGRIYGSPVVMGDIHHITINNVDTKKTAVPVRVTAPLQDCWINKVHKGFGDSSTPPIIVADGADMGNTILTNIKQV